MPTSLGIPTSLFVPRLIQRGYDVPVSAALGLVGQPIAVAAQGFDGEAVELTILPGDSLDFFGNSAIGRNARIVKPDLIVTLVEAWGLEPASLEGMPQVASFIHLEYEPVSEPVRRYLKDTGATPIAITRNCEELLRADGFDPLYVPLPVDTTTFRPHSRADARQQLGLPQEAFIVGMVGMNRYDGDRKSFAESFVAFSLFRAEHPDALLLLHANTHGGLDLLELADQLGIGDAILEPDYDRLVAGLYTPAEMALTYSAMNVLLAPSKGEAFCLPLLEAQACGTPVITTDFGATAEIGAVGWRVGGQRLYLRDLAAVALSKPPPFQDPNVWAITPDIEQLKDALEEAYGHAETLRESAREHAMAYDADHVSERYLIPALERAGVQGT